MAIPKIKATYSLDVETTRLLERLAERWGVSKSAALRRTIRSAARRELEGLDPDDALARLQSELGLTPETAREWEERARGERHALGSELDRGDDGSEADR